MLPLPEFITDEGNLSPFPAPPLRRQQGPQARLRQSGFCSLPARQPRLLQPQKSRGKCRHQPAIALARRRVYVLRAVLLIRSRWPALKLPLDDRGTSLRFKLRLSKAIISRSGVNIHETRAGMNLSIKAVQTGRHLIDIILPPDANAACARACGVEAPAKSSAAPTSPVPGCHRR